MHRSTRYGHRFVVSGRVQGVGFRAATRRKAVALGLNGWARNLPDGRVEVVAGGDTQALRALRAWLEHGPAPARVDRVEDTGDVELFDATFVTG